MMNVHPFISGKVNYSNTITPNIMKVKWIYNAYATQGMDD